MPKLGYFVSYVVSLVCAIILALIDKKVRHGSWEGFNNIPVFLGLANTHTLRLVLMFIMLGFTVQFLIQTLS